MEENTKEGLAVIVRTDKGVLFDKHDLMERQAEINRKLITGRRSLNEDRSDMPSSSKKKRLNYPV